MKLRNPGLIRLVAFLAAVFIRVWMSTVRKRYQARNLALHPERTPADLNYVYAFWHETLLVPATVPGRSRFHALISRHADGELIAQVCKHLGIGTVRGSTNKGGVPALREMVRKASGGHLAVTPDGPRGPRRQVQIGIVFLAAQTGMPIVPAGIGYTRAWRARSWDRFAVPLPGSTTTLVAGDAIHVPAEVNRAELERYRDLVERAMLRATAEAEAWASQLASRS